MAKERYCGHLDMQTADEVTPRQQQPQDVPTPTEEPSEKNCRACGLLRVHLQVDLRARGSADGGVAIGRQVVRGGGACIVEYLSMHASATLRLASERLALCPRLRTPSAAPASPP